MGLEEITEAKSDAIKELQKENKKLKKKIKKLKKKNKKFKQEYSIPRDGASWYDECSDKQ